MEVHPGFDIERAEWFTDTGFVAKSLGELQQKLPKAKIIGYYPQGFGTVKQPPRKDGDPIRALTNPTMQYTGLNRAIFSQRQPQAPKAQRPKLSQEEKRLLKARKEYEELNGIVPQEVIAEEAPTVEPGSALDKLKTAAQGSANGLRRWTSELNELLAYYVERGYYADQIAVCLGQGFTKNAVIGQCHRRGYQLRHRNGRFPIRR